MTSTISHLPIIKHILHRDKPVTLNTTQQQWSPKVRNIEFSAEGARHSTSRTRISFSSDSDTDLSDDEEKNNMYNTSPVVKCTLKFILKVKRISNTQRAKIPAPESRHTQFTEQQLFAVARSEQVLPSVDWSEPHPQPETESLLSSTMRLVSHAFNIRRPVDCVLTTESNIVF